MSRNTLPVIPMKMGIYMNSALDFRFRGNDIA